MYAVPKEGGNNNSTGFANNSSNNNNSVKSIVAVDAEIENLKVTNIDVKGELNIDNIEDLDQLRCTAKVTKGELYNANTYAELVHSLNKSFNSEKRVDAKILY